MCKPNKTGWERRFKPRELALRREWDKREAAL